MLLKYAWANDACFPGQITRAEDRGAAERSVRTYLKELETAELLEIKQRGLGKTNLYRLHLTIKSKGVRRYPRRRAQHPAIDQRHPVPAADARRPTARAPSFR
jgi:hypothetical protein